jgi:hypothetical protein
MEYLPSGIRRHHHALRSNKENKMFLGLRNVVYHVGNLDEAKHRYVRMFDVSPYFDEPFNVGVNIKVATVKDLFGNVVGIIENPYSGTK